MPAPFSRPAATTAVLIETASCHDRTCRLKLSKKQKPLVVREGIPPHPATVQRDGAEKSTDHVCILVPLHKRTAPRLTPARAPFMDVASASPPVPPFTKRPPSRRCAPPKMRGTTAIRRKCHMAYTEDANRTAGRSSKARKSKGVPGAQVVKKLEYRLIKEYWAHGDERIAVRFAYEYNTADGKWFGAYGNENWEFDENGPD